MLFFKFIFLLVIVAVSVLVIGVWMLVFKLKRMAEKISGKDSFHAGGSRHDAFSGSSEGSQSRGSATRDDDYYDERGHAGAQRKIIPKDEGEYVDFEEVKE